jgi:site-specific DNA-adenine methylase
MTCYHGGKQRIGKRLAEIIVEESIDISNEYDFKIKGYCEPFCGMLGVFRHIPEFFNDKGLNKLKYKAGDVNDSVIKMWNFSQKGWKPPTTITQEKYTKLKNSHSSPLKGYIGHQYSYGGQWFNGYSPNYGKSKDSTTASKNVQYIAKSLKDVKFTSGSYKQFSNLKGYVIYCDPPYEGTHCRYQKEDENNISFDIKEFWKWCDEMCHDNVIFVSSYKAPKGIQCIYSSNHKLSGHTMKERNRTEKLYLLY